MSYEKRHDARRDDSEKGIVADLKKAGWHAWRKLPVDLLLWPPVNGYRVMECKSLGKPCKPKDGPQKEFVELTGCPIVNSSEGALKALAHGK